MPAAWEQDLLARSAADFAYPPTPDVVSRVSAAVAAAPARGRPAAVRRLRPAGVLALVLAITAAAVLAVPSVRDAVADFLGLAVPGERIEILPTPAPWVTPTPFPTPQDIAAIATPIAKEGAASRLGFVPAYPPGRGEPRGIYLVDYAGVAVLVLDYEEFALWETRSGIFEKALGGFGKGLPPSTVLEQMTVNGRPAYWIQGGGHIVRFIGPDGKEVAGSQRTVLGNTLVWRGEATNYRLETDLPKERAIAIAASLP